uniref:Uncharacterized protein n=1 Tax=Maylandia zebra TaxID=106582 RepID=A0A3P9AWD0_9CICH
LKVTGSRTCTRMTTEPDLGDPPSKAVRSKFITLCFSLSRVFSSMSSTLLLSTARIKLSFF